MKRCSVIFRAAWAAAVLLTAGFDAAAWPQETEQEQKQEKKTEQISDEDREVIEHMEMLKSLNLFDNEDMEMLKNLDVLTANE